MKFVEKEIRRQVYFGAKFVKSMCLMKIRCADFKLFVLKHLSTLSSSNFSEVSGTLFDKG